MSKYRSQPGSPTCLTVEAMGIDDNYLWKHMQICSNFSLFKNHAQCLLKVKVPEPYPKDSDSEDLGVPRESEFYPNSALL